MKAPIVFRADLRIPMLVPLEAGRHTIALKCGEAWSDELTFYWEKQP